MPGTPLPTFRSQSAVLADMLTYASSRFYSGFTGLILGYLDGKAGNTFASGAISMKGVMPTVATAGLAALTDALDSEPMGEIAKDTGAEVSTAAIYTSLRYATGFAAGAGENAIHKLLESLN